MEEEYLDYDDSKREVVVEEGLRKMREALEKNLGKNFRNKDPRQRGFGEYQAWVGQTAEMLGVPAKQVAGMVKGWGKDTTTKTFLLKERFLQAQKSDKKNPAAWWMYMYKNVWK